MDIRKIRRFFVITVSLAVTTIIPVRVFAAESVTVPAEQDIIAVDFPALQEDEKSPFDFIVDPQNLTFETGASLYGGGEVEEGANLLFHNHTEDGYDFSRYSDRLTVTNRSTVPVKFS